MSLTRYIHRGRFEWELEKKKKSGTSLQGQIFERLSEIERIRASHTAFLGDADVRSINTYDDSVICVSRILDDEEIIGVFNFSEHEKTCWPGAEGAYRDLHEDHGTKCL